MVWEIAGVLVGLLAALVLWLYWRRKKQEARQHADLQTIFGRQSCALPALEIGNAYGWDTFTVTFESKAALDAAVEAGLTDLFTKRISGYYGPDFDPQLAIGFLYEGWYRQQAWYQQLDEPPA